MATDIWRTGSDLKIHWQGEWTQWVLQCEREKRECTFFVNINPNFPLHETTSVIRYDHHCHITVNFMGLFGHHGMMPTYYQSILNQANRNKQNGLFDFISLFQHRIIHLHYRVWLHARPLLRQENSIKILSGLAGIVSSHSFFSPSLLHYTGLLRKRPLSRFAIERILSDYFDLPIRLFDFQKNSLTLEMHDLTNLSKKKLGIDMILGQTCWQQQGQCLMEIGPLNRQQFQRCLPKQPLSQALCKMARYLVPLQIHIQIRLVLKAKAVPCLQLCKKNPPRLGLTSWCRHHEFKKAARDIVYYSILTPFEIYKNPP